MTDQERTLRECIAANLRAERARRGLRQSDLADLVGLPRTTLADLETGRRAFPITDLVALCEALDVGLSSLLAGREPAAVHARRVLAGPDLAALQRGDLERLRASADLETEHQEH